MAITLNKLEQYLDELEFNYQQKDEDTLLTGAKDENGQVMIVIRLMEDGEFLQIRTVQHLDDLVKEANDENRAALLSWMLYRNYQTKLGAWEYDPSDHDHHISIGFGIEDGDLTLKQFARMLNTITKSCEIIPEMKQVLCVEAEIDPKELKRQELLAQLAALDGNTGI
nr:YbjN domain-containing protein [uncultured Amphritea sp.]